MSTFSIESATLTAIADALRDKGHEGKITAGNFATKTMQLAPLEVYWHTEIEYDDEKATEIVAVAQSYLDAIADGRLTIVYKAGYSTLSGTNQRLKTDDGVYCIQCSAFAGLVMRGISYENSPFYDGDGSKVLARTDLYTWANSDYQMADVTEANQLCLYAYQNGCILNGNTTANIKKGDLLFFAKNDNSYFGNVWHVGVAMEDEGRVCVHALNGQASGIWTFDITNPPAILGDLAYVARPRYNVDFSKEPEIVPLVILEHPQDYTGTAGETAVFKVTAQGEGLSYVWQYSSNGSTWYQSGFDGWNTDTQPVAVATYRNNQKYRCIVTDKYGNSVTSNVATLYCTS